MVDGFYGATPSNTLPSSTTPENSEIQDISQPDSGVQVVVIDTTVEGHEGLIAGIAEGTEIILVGEGGLAELAQALEGHDPIDSLQILSHGDVGTFQLGGDTVSTDTLGEHADLLKIIGDSLSDDGDILLYGCRVGEGGDGMAFLRALTLVTGADIAASDDLTGNSAQGGDWDLEVNVGDVEETIVFSTASLEGFDRTLAAPSVGTEDFGTTATFTLDTTSVANVVSSGFDAGASGGSEIDIVTFNRADMGTSNVSNTDFIGEDIIWTGKSLVFGDLEVNHSVQTINYISISTNDDSSFQLNGFDFWYKASGTRTFTITGHDASGTQISGATYSLTSLQENTDVGGRQFGYATVSAADLGSSFDNIVELRITPSNTDMMLMGIDDVVVAAAVTNSAPAISLDNATLAYTEDQSAVQIDSAGTVSDSDGDSDWNGGTLVVQITANAEASDQISISDTDGDGTAITVSGTNIFSNGTDIGDLSTSGGTVTNGTALTITFDSDATNANVQEVLQSLRYESTSDDPGTSNRTVTITATDSSADSNSDTRTVSMTSVNDEPTLTATGSNPTFTEDGSAASLFSGASVSTIESGQTISGLTLTVTNVNDGSDEVLSIDGTSIALTNANSGTTATNSLSYSVAVSGATATVTLSGGAVSTSAMQTLVDGITYSNSSEDPNTSNRVVTLTSIQDSGGTTNGGDNTAALAVASTVSMTTVNDEPTLTATGSDPTFTEDGSAASLFSGTSVSTVESGQTISSLTLTVTNVNDGSDEVLSIDGTSIALTNANSGTTATNSLSYSVAVSGTTATVTLSGGTVSTSAMQTLVDGITYSNSSDGPTTSDRVVTLTSIQDSGGTSDGGDNTAALSVASTVGISAVNDAPALNSGESPTLTAVDEDAGDDDGSGADGDDDVSDNTNNGGTTVATMVVDSSITDPDGSAVESVAVTAVDNTNGVWQYSTDSGTSWNNFSGTTGTSVNIETSARLLDSADMIRFVPDADYNGSATITFRAWDETSGSAGGTADASSNGGTTAFSSASDTASVTVNAVNDAPTFSGLDGAPSFTEGGSVVTFDSDVTISDIELDAADDFSGASLTIARNGGANASDDFDFDTSGASFSVSGGNLQTAGLTFATFTDNSGTLTINFTSAGATATGALVDEVLQRITYQNTSNDPGSSAQMDWSFSDGTDSDTGSTTVSITGVNDEPTLTATGSDPTFVEGGSNQDLFSGVTIDTVESGQTISGMTLTVTNVSDTGEEFMEIDGTSIDITQASSGTTSTNSLSYSVAFSAGTATITLSGGTLSEAATQTLVDGMTYGHTSDDPSAGSSRVVTLTSITDSGSNTGDNDNVATLAVSSTVSITAVNDAPVVSNLNGDNASSVTAGAGAEDVTDLNDVTVTNADSADYNGGFATLSQLSGTTNGDWSVDGTNVTSGGDATVSAGETIQVGGVSIGTVDATNDGQGGNTLTINFNSANATSANIQTLIQNLELSAPSGVGDRAFTLVLNDGDGTANGGDQDTAATFTVGVTGSAPTMTNLDGDSLTFTEGDSATLLDVSSNATLTDADSSNFDGGDMTVTFQSGGQAAEDLLTFDTSGVVSLAGTTAGSNVSVSGTVVGTLGNNISAGNDLVVNFNTDATPARVQELLRAIQYNNEAGDNPTDGDRVVRVTITDAASNATTGTADITVNVDPVNDAASGTGLPTDVTVTEDTASDVDLSAADFTDPDSASVTVTLTIDDGTFSSPADGAGVGGGVDETLVSSTSITLVGAPDDIDTYLDTASNIQYTGSSNTNGDDAATITVTINDGDGSGDVSVGTVNIDITAVNDDPTGTGLPTDVTVTEDTASAVDLSAANFGDVDSATITVTLTLDDGTFSSPADGAGVGSGVTETLVSSTVITLVGDADDIDTYLDTASNIQYTGSADTNGDNAASITVTANDGDGSGDVAIGTVNVDITAVNDDPTGTSLPTDVTVTEDTASDVDLSAADFGDVDSASITVTLTIDAGTFSTPADGAGVGGGVDETLVSSTEITLVGAPDDIDTYLDTASNIQYTSAANADTDDAATITVTANDGDGSGDVSIGTVSVDVTGVNDLPTSSGGSISTAEDSNKTFASGNFNFSDVDTGDTLQSVRIDTLPSTGTLKLSGVNVTAGDVIAVGDIGNLTFNPPSNQSGSTSFTYSVNDGTGFATSAATMNISISARNDAPTNVSLSNSSVQEVVPGAIVGTVSASDVDDSSLTYTVSDSRFTIDNNNQLKLKAGQTLDFETEPTVTVTLTATDDDGASDSDDFTIAVIDVNEIINSGNNDDTIDGTDNDDYVQSGSGNNRIRTGGGKDTIDGGDGNDDIGGGNDDDFIKGGGGNDTVDGGLGNDLVYAGLGDLGDDTVLGSGGLDSLGGGAGNDKLDGGDNDDLLWGRFGDDTVDGGTGDDMLYNGEGSDTVMGGTGDDTLWAGAGDDVLSGGSGEDVFIFGATSGNDTISDFELANDTLDLQYSGAGFDALADVQGAASDVTQNGEAGLLIDLGNGQSVFLIGLDTGDLASMTITL